jgi:hypothetical protein
MKKNYFLILIAVLVITLTSCASTNQISTIAAKKALENGEWGTPETHTLLFGINGEDAKQTSKFLQQNPDIGYKFLETYGISNEKTILLFITIEKGRFFLYPQPVGSELKEFSWWTYESHLGYDSIKTIYEGIGGVDITLTKPGLQFYGNDKENHKEELKTLKKMVKYFKGSAWETLIKSRIEEISNAK